MFDPQSLAQLGLGGMPGFNLGQPAQQDHQQQQALVSYNSMYPSLDGLSKHSRSSSHGSGHGHSSSQNRQIAPLPQNRRGAGGMAGFEQAISYPPLSTLQTLPSVSSDNASPGGSYQPAPGGDFNFDMLAKSSGAAPEAALLPMSSNQNKYRNVDMLGASRYNQAAPRGSLDLLSEACEEAAAELEAPREAQLHDEPEEMDEEDLKQEDSPPILPHHLLSEREAGTEFKLPALKLGRPPRSEPLDPIGRLQHRSNTSTSTTSTDSIPSSRPSTGHTTPGRDSRSRTPDIYPSFGKVCSADDDHLVGRVDRMDLDAPPSSGPHFGDLVGQSLKHAKLIRDILVAVNREWKRRHRTAPQRLQQIEITPDDIKPSLAELNEQATPSTPTRRSIALQ